MDFSPPGSSVHGILQARILVGTHFFLHGNFPDSGTEPRSATLLGFPGRSDSKEPVCSTGDPSSIPGLGRSSTDGKGYPLQYSWASVVAQLVKDTQCNAGDLGSIPGLERSPGEGNSYQCQYSGLENSRDCIVHEVTKSRIQLSDFHFHFSHIAGRFFGKALGLMWPGFKVCPFKEDLHLFLLGMLEDHIHVNFYIWRIRARS